jgi:uncharacterized protein (TIGR03382 family)
MMLRAALVFSALFATAATAAPTTTLPPLDTTIGAKTRVIPGQLLVRAAPKADPAKVAALVSHRLGRTLTVVQKRSLDWIQLEDRSARTETATLALVDDAKKKVPGLRGVAAVWVWHTLSTPNDPLYDYMWHLETIGAPAMWDVTTGSTASRVGVVDTGTLFNHEDLAGKQGTGFDFVSDSSASNDGNGRDSDATDAGDDCQGEGDSFHGTHVAGTILANRNNGIGIAGINGGAKLVTGRALGRCGGSTVDINEAVLWMSRYQVDGVTPIAVEDQPRVINLSLGVSDAPCDDYTQSVWEAVTSTGSIIVVAAGNDGNNVDVGSPASCPDSVAVAAYGITSSGSIQLSSFSNFGDEIDIVAPGGEQARGIEYGVLSATDDSLSMFQDGSPYSFQQGTSMAAPHVTGVISLMVDLNPSLDRDAVVQILQSTGGSCINCQGKLAMRGDLAVAAAEGEGEGEGEGEPGEGEGEGEGEDAECDERRGNMDCDVGAGCEDGECVRGADGDLATRELCERNSDCGSGLCDLGVCTVTCDDEDCPDGYKCLDEEDSGVPGGLCTAKSCKDDASICGSSAYACSYSSDNRYVCAVGPSNYGGLCGATPKETAPLAVLAMALLRRRRRR